MMQSMATKMGELQLEQQAFMQAQSQVKPLDSSSHTGPRETLFVTPLKRGGDPRDVSGETGKSDYRSAARGVLKVEFPKAKLGVITGSGDEDIEKLLRQCERRIRIPNQGRDLPAMDKVELLCSICQKDADKE